MDKARIGFIGAGGIARAHAYCLQAVSFYYPDAPEIEPGSVCSATEESRTSFAQRYGFSCAEPLESFVRNMALDSIYILSPNHAHFTHFKAVLEMKNVRRIYLEKPVCSTWQEEKEMAALGAATDKTIRVGFQYLLTPSVREALILWRTGVFGKPLHFDLKYYHGDYLRESYRQKRKSRLTEAPDGGAMADLGCHGLSLLTAFLGNGLKMTGAVQAGSFSDVPAGSDLFSIVSLIEPNSMAVGHLSASRISSGSGDMVYLEIFAEKGAIRYSSLTPDFFEYYLENDGRWVRQPVGSSYSPVSSFPSVHAPAGWLRSMVHAHYLFLGGNDPEAFIANLDHGLEVQRLVRESAAHLDLYRKNHCHG